MKTLVKFRPQRLQLHARFQAIRRLRPAPDESVNLFLNIYQRLFHGCTSLVRSAVQSK